MFRIVLHVHALPFTLQKRTVFLFWRTIGRYPNIFLANKALALCEEAVRLNGQKLNG